MSAHVKGPRLISDMAAEEFSLPNSVDRATWRRSRGRGLAERNKRDLTRITRSGKSNTNNRPNDRFMRTRSSSFSGPGNVNDARGCRLSIATVGRHGETPFLATLDKSGKIFVNRQKGGKGDNSRGRRFRANSMVSTYRGRRDKDVPIVPGGTTSDPLNLQVEDLPETPPTVPQPDPKRFDRPANNFIPTNQWDPLGLTNDDDTVPVCLTYNPHATKRKRVRARKKDPASADATTSHSNMEVADGSTSATNATSDADETIVAGASCESKQNAPSCAPVPAPATKTDSKEDVKEVKSDDSHTPMLSNSVEDLNSRKTSDDDSKVSARGGDSTVSKLDSGVGDGPSVKVHAGGHSVKHGGHPVREKGDGGHSVKHGGHPVREKGDGHPEVRPTRIEPRVKTEQQRAAFEIAQHRLQKYPVMPSPIDVQEKMEIPRDRKSFIEALKIEQMGQEEQERIVKEQKKQLRDFRRQRFPNLKSPAEDVQAVSTGPSVMEPLKIDTDSAGKPIVHGQLSRTLDSIVSPKFQPHHSQLRKRRRTISDCTGDAGSSAAKALNFQRSSSPDMSRASTPSPKKRRLSSGSGSGKFKKKGEQLMGPPQVKFAKNPVFKFGNYYRYYGYRTPEMEPDFRLQYLRLEWFEGKDVLDIGCNSGQVTLAIAQLFHPQKIVGMDIDPSLIRVARQNIKSYQSLAGRAETKRYPMSMAEYGPIEPLPALTNPSNYFPKNIMFMQGNYVLERDDQLNYVKQEYDSILALSITKWIHLNSGDDGLKRAFARMFQQLRPGGRLILEPQAWVTYRRRKKLTETIYKNYNNIRLKPDQFSDYLLNQVGFCKREVIGVPAHPSKEVFTNAKVIMFMPDEGFQRQLLLFTKFSDQSYSPPNLVAPYPSGPPAVYSIAERMATLAGYSSTPGGVNTPGLGGTPTLAGYSSTPGGADTPGLCTPSFTPATFQIGESTPPSNVSVSGGGGSSSSSLCSTCMSRASSGVHESDSDFVGYPAGAMPQGFPPFHHSSSPGSSSGIPLVNGLGSLSDGSEPMEGAHHGGMFGGAGDVGPPPLNGLGQDDDDNAVAGHWHNDAHSPHLNDSLMQGGAAADDEMSDEDSGGGGGGGVLRSPALGLDQGVGGSGGWVQMPVQMVGLDSARGRGRLPTSSASSVQGSPAVSVPLQSNASSRQGSPGSTLPLQPVSSASSRQGSPGFNVPLQSVSNASSMQGSPVLTLPLQCVSSTRSSPVAAPCQSVSSTSGTLESPQLLNVPPLSVSEVSSTQAPAQDNCDQVTPVVVGASLPDSSHRVVQDSTVVSLDSAGQGVSDVSSPMVPDSSERDPVAQERGNRRVPANSSQETNPHASSSNLIEQDPPQPDSAASHLIKQDAPQPDSAASHLVEQDAPQPDSAASHLVEQDAPQPDSAASHLVEQDAPQPDSAASHLIEQDAPQPDSAASHLVEQDAPQPDSEASHLVEQDAPRPDSEASHLMEQDAPQPDSAGNSGSS